jgi:hypothetical protein
MKEQQGYLFGHSPHLLLHIVFLSFTPVFKVCAPLLVLVSKTKKGVSRA